MADRIDNQKRLPGSAITMPASPICTESASAAPAGTPRDVIARLNAETNKALRSAEVIEQFRLQGYEPIGGTPEALDALIRDDVARWTTIIRDAGIMPQ